MKTLDEGVNEGILNLRDLKSGEAANGIFSDLKDFQEKGQEMRDRMLELEQG